ncbi:uncharacterized protein [Littorina saxatilis]|uniref:uncharacterized protein n=1 Tax=Littorina saxatilis TaxID=31220 RepID=UPI0038B67E50
MGVVIGVMNKTASTADTFLKTDTGQTIFINTDQWTCPDGYWQCNSRQCTRSEGRCDGHRFGHLDCRDGSDEDNCDSELFPPLTSISTTITTIQANEPTSISLTTSSAGTTIETTDTDNPTSSSVSTSSVRTTIGTTETTETYEPTSIRQSTSSAGTTIATTDTDEPNSPSLSTLSVSTATGTTEKDS